jgi:signal transduction histidine kinase
MCGDEPSPTVVPVKPRPPLLDVGIAAVFVAMTVAEALLNPEVESLALHVGVAGTAMVALAWRRRAPVLVAAVVAAANMISNPQGEFSTLLSLVLVCFTVGYETSPPRSYLGLGLVFVPFLVASVLQGFEPSDLAAGLVFFVGPWTVGTLVSQRTASAEAALARAAQLEREAELEAASARAEERTRIARELHDIVSHSISVVTIQTQAVRRRLGPDHAREAADLAAVEATAREALAEMRRLFGVLRAESGESPGLAPQPGLAELDRLVSQVGAGDMAVRLEIEGDPVPLSPGLDLAAYRIAQEGLTNAVRHAGATEARVLVRYGSQRLDVEVADNGRGMNGEASGGHGLVGIRERVALYGGTVTLEPSAAGGVRLAASLPLGDPAVGR